MVETYDLAVIGGGPGGYTAAIRASQLRMRVALIEREAVGGLCLNWGCIPSKALLAGADMLSLMRHGAEFGIRYDNLTADLGVAVDRSRRVVDGFVKGVESLLSQNKVDVIRGTGRLAGPNTVRVAPRGESIEARNILIATGAVTRSLPGIAPDGDRILTSREALALREMPASIVIVGGGPIGCEFAYLYRSYGAEVTLVEVLPRLLPNEDEDVSRQLERSFAAQGVGVRTGTSVAGISVGRNGVAVRLQAGDAGEEIQAERVLIGVGLGADNNSLGLTDAGVETDEQGWIRIDEYAQTNVASVWAAGDVTGRMLLAHVASHQGVAAVEKMAGQSPPPLDYDQMPRAVYCQPQVASLGLSEAEARERGIDVRVGRFPFRASGKAMAADETDGFVKLVVDSATRAIVGWHIVGHNATELLGEATIATVLEATTAELSYAVHAHPTIAEALKEAAQAATGEAIHIFHGRTS